MTMAAAAWCVICGGPPELAVTYERRGVLAHYGSCRDHAAEVARRAAGDLARLELEDQTEARLRAEGRARWETVSGYLDVSEQWLAENAGPPPEELEP